MRSVDVVVLGSGHYVTGQTSLPPEIATDKDRGVVLPSLLYMRSTGLVGKITVVGQSADKLEAAAKAVKDDTLLGDVNRSFVAVSAGSTDSPIEEALMNASSSTVVIIALPDHLHKDAMLQCAKKGLPFLVLKPAVTCLPDYYEVLEAIPDSLTVMVDYHKSYDQANLLLRDKIQTGFIGSVQFVSSVMSQRDTMLDLYRRWLGTDKPPNVNHYLGSHYIHLTSKIIDGEPVQVRATQQFGKASKLLGRPVADRIQTHVLWKKSDGTEASSFHLAGWTDSPLSPFMTRQEIEVFGSRGSIRSDQAFRGISLQSDSHGTEIPNPYFFGIETSFSAEWNPSATYGFQSIAVFIRAVAQGQTGGLGNWLPTFKDSESVTAVLEAADLSLRESSAAISISRNRESGRLEIGV